MEILTQLVHAILINLENSNTLFEMYRSRGSIANPDFYKAEGMCEGFRS